MLSGDQQDACGLVLTAAHELVRCPSDLFIPMQPLVDAILDAGERLDVSEHAWQVRYVPAAAALCTV